MGMRPYSKLKGEDKVEVPTGHQTTPEVETDADFWLPKLAEWFEQTYLSRFQCCMHPVPTGKITAFDRKVVRHYILTRLTR
jgi:hypothetical protein